MPACAGHDIARFKKYCLITYRFTTTEKQQEVLVSHGNSADKISPGNRSKRGRQAGGKRKDNTFHIAFYRTTKTLK